MRARGYVPGLMAFVAAVVLSTLADMPTPLAVFLGLVVGFLAYVAFNLPRRYRRFGLGQAHEAAENGNGFFGRTYPEAPHGPRDSAQSQIGRNDPCPCGSGRKFKHCHGSVQESTSG